jgi:hypothetical protein
MDSTLPGARPPPEAAVTPLIAWGAPRMATAKRWAFCGIIGVMLSSAFS